MDCPFCQEEIRTYAFRENKNFLAIYNVAPILKGHSLIIPRKHLTSLLDLSEQELAEMTIFAKEVTMVLLKAFHSDSFNWSLQDNEAAGQTVMHLHLHLIPRYKDDMPEAGDWYPKISENNETILDTNLRPRHSKDEMLQIVAKLRETSI